MYDATEMQPYIPAPATQLEETGPTRHPTRAQAYLLFLTVLVLNALGQAIIGTLGLPFPISITLSEVLFILLPVLLFLRLGKFDFKATLYLNRTSPLLLLLSALTALLAWPLAEILGFVVDKVLRTIGPLPQLVPTPTSGLAAIATFFALTVVPGICEETLNRGVLQRAFARQGLWRTVLYVGLFFPLFHLAFYPLLFTFMLGSVLSYLVFKTNSIYNAMLCHAAFNGVTASLIVLSYFKVVPDNLESMDWLLPLAVITTPLLLAVLYYVGRLTAATKQEEGVYVAPIDNSMVRGRISFAELSLLTVILVIFIVMGAAELLLRYSCASPNAVPALKTLCGT